MWTLCFDGGASPNPGIGRCAFKAESEDGTIIEDKWRMDGIRTNNEAEWEAVTVGIERIVKAHPDTEIIKVIGDSLLVIQQIKGIYAVKNYKLRGYRQRIGNIEERYKIAITAHHVHREHNSEMDTACKSAC